MKKLIVFIVCLCFTSIANAQLNNIYCEHPQTGCSYTLDNTMLSTSMFSRGKTVLKSTGKPINGFLCTYISGTKKLTNYWDGKKHGIEITCYANGQVQSEVFYKNNSQEGIARTYYDSGRLGIEYSMKEYRLDGHYQVFRENGRLWYKVLYREGDAIDGTCRDGRKWTRAELVNWENNQRTVTSVPCEF